MKLHDLVLDLLMVANVLLGLGGMGIVVNIVSLLF